MAARVTVLCFALAALLVPALAVGRPTEIVRQPSYGDHSAVCGKANASRSKVVRKFGDRAPGRDICHDGVRGKSGLRPATRSEEKAYLGALEQMLAPPPAAVPAAVGTAVPSGSSAPGSSTASCIISAESGGNPQATNGQYGGIAQWSPEAWSRMGGTAYSSTPQGASYAQQMAVLNHGLATYGSGDWSPYDGC